jgi:polyphosphate kinase 2 (PPK2 family)
VVFPTIEDLLGVEVRCPKRSRNPRIHPVKKTKKTVNVEKSKPAAALDGRVEITKKTYLDELRALQIELVKLQEWVRFKGLKVIVLFEGRDACRAGWGHQAHHREPEPARLPGCGITPHQRREKTTMVFFSAYVCPHSCWRRKSSCLTAAGTNRAGVERVMGFCTDDEYSEFLRSYRS